MEQGKSQSPNHSHNSWIQKYAIMNWWDGKLRIESGKGLRMGRADPNEITKRDARGTKRRRVSIPWGRDPRSNRVSNRGSKGRKGSGCGAWESNRNGNGIVGVGGGWRRGPCRGTGVDRVTSGWRGRWHRHAIGGRRRRRRGWVGAPSEEARLANNCWWWLCLCVHPPCEGEEGGWVHVIVIVIVTDRWNVNVNVGWFLYFVLVWWVCCCVSCWWGKERERRRRRGLGNWKRVEDLRNCPMESRFVVGI